MKPYVLGSRRGLRPQTLHSAAGNPLMQDTVSIRPSTLHEAQQPMFQDHFQRNRSPLSLLGGQSQGTNAQNGKEE